MKRIMLLMAVVAISAAFDGCTSEKEEQVEFKHEAGEQAVDVYVDGSFFTSFIYPDNMEKQVLYPITSASGKIITRGYPMDPRPFERTDHPHHVGMWFNFGNVNGLDFWNNSFAIKPENKPRYGTILFREIVSENPAKGELVVASDWVDHQGTVLLKEETTYLFSGKENFRAVERNTRLRAVEQVTFTENKEGLLGLRLDRAFEEPATKPGKFLDANGIETEVPVMNNDGVNGVYRNAEGLEGGAVWGKRSPWVALRAEKEGEVITIVVFDHPQNVNYPAWSHARGYGLFATNNLAGRAVDQTADPVKVELQPGEELLFRHKVIIGGDLTDGQIEEMRRAFSESSN
ncbi:MAG: PmoA family protein [Mangrovibacterium sp.]